MGPFTLFLPCAAGVEDYLTQEVQALLGLSPGIVLHKQRGGVAVQGTWRDALRLNLHSRLAQRILVQVSRQPYRTEDDLYRAASEVSWEDWFTARHTFKVDITSQHSPLKSLHFAALRVKDAVADRFRDRQGTRPSVNTEAPDVRLFVHLSVDHIWLYLDTSGQPLFKRGWRADKGDAPLKETLAVAMIAATGWRAEAPLYDPCCGSGTIVIEAAQIACGMAPGLQRGFAFERLLPFALPEWADLQAQARAATHPPSAPIFGSDVAHRMVDFAQRNAQRAGVAHALQLRGGDGLQRMPPAASGTLLLNPPYGERIDIAGVAGTSQQRGRETFVTEHDADFFAQLASHWKKNYAGWTAWILSPDPQLPSRMRLKAARRVPLWNGPIECRLFRFDMLAGSARAATDADTDRVEHDAR